MVEVRLAEEELLVAGKLKVKCKYCNDWGSVKDAKQNMLDIPCPKNCGGRRKPSDPWEYEEDDNSGTLAVAAALGIGSEISDIISGNSDDSSDFGGGDFSGGGASSEW